MKPYCTQNGGDCETCSLVNYGRDCQNNPLEPEGISETTPADLVEVGANISE